MKPRDNTYISHRVSSLPIRQCRGLIHKQYKATARFPFTLRKSVYVEAPLLTTFLKVLLPGIHTLLQSHLLVGIGKTGVVSEYGPRIDLERDSGVTWDHIACRLGTSPTTAAEILIICITVLNATWVLQACHRSNKEQQLSRLKTADELNLTSVRRSYYPAESRKTQEQRRAFRRLRRQPIYTHTCACPYPGDYSLGS